MTTPFENFVNTALGKSLSADVTLPTADDIPVFTGIGRQVTGKTKAELGLALTADLDTDGTLADNSDTKYPSQKAVKTYADTKQAALVSGTNIKTVNGSSLLGSGDLITATIPEVKSASFTAVTGKAYTLGSPGSTLNIQFPIGTTNGEEIIIHVNRSAQTQEVYTLPPAGQHVVYVGAGNYQLVSGFCDHILRFEFVLSTLLWELKGIVPAGSITDAMSFCSSTNILARLKFSLPTADGVYQWYTPAKDINFGDLPSVATTNSNTLSGTRTRILGGSHNTVSGTDNVVVGCTSVTTSSSLGQYIQASSGSTAGIDWPTRFIGSGTLRGTTAYNTELAEVITQLKALNIYDAGSEVLTTDGGAATASNTPKHAGACPYDDALSNVATHELDLQVVTRSSTGLYLNTGITHAKYLISVLDTAATATLVATCSTGTVATFTVTPTVVSGRLYITVANTTGSDKPVRVRGVLKSLYSYL